MNPIDWNKLDPSPLGEDTISRLLTRRWAGYIMFEGRWFRIYAFYILCLIFLGLHTYWRYSSGTTGDWDPSDFMMRTGTVAILGVFLILRFYMSAIPALVVCRDTQKSLWEHFRITSVTGDDVASSMLHFALSFSVFPLAIICTLETLLFFWCTQMTLGISKIPVLILPIAIFYILYTLALNAFGYIGALVWRHPVGVYGGILFPVILSLLSAGKGWFVDFITSFSARYTTSLGTHAVTALLTPENRMAFSGEAIIRQGFTSFPATEPMTVVSMAVGIGVIAAFMWIALWLILRYRLRMG
ncbi:hypothetical protein KAU08_10910 [bacterium]|nr:hypothetical protein [bacterium]